MKPEAWRPPAKRPPGARAPGRCRLDKGPGCGGRLVLRVSNGLKPLAAWGLAGGLLHLPQQIERVSVCCEQGRRDGFAVLGDLLGRVAVVVVEAAGGFVDEDEDEAVDAVAAWPADGEGVTLLVDVDVDGAAFFCYAEGKAVGGVEEPGVAVLGGEEQEVVDGDNQAVTLGGALLDVGHLVHQFKTLLLKHRLLAHRSPPQ